MSTYNKAETDSDQRKKQWLINGERDGRWDKIGEGN